MHDRNIGPAVAALFLLAALAGSVALTLSVQADGGILSFADATFTAVSALTLTGLTVVDTETLPRAAQTTLAVLIGVGAVGVTTIVIGALQAVGRASWAGRRILSADLGTGDATQLRRLLIVVTAGYALVAAFGTVTLHAAGLEWFHAVFYAISGIGNAGFTTLPGSLKALTTAGVTTVNLLVIIGSIGYVAWFEMFDRSRSRSRQLGITARIVLTGTAVLLPFGAAALAATEWNNDATLGPLTGSRRAAALLTLTVMPRSAGFNLTDTTALTEGGKLVTTILMYLGGGPASTSGGIKITGAAVLALAVAAAVRGRSQVGVRSWQVGPSTVALATAVAVALTTTIFLLAAVLTTTGATFGDALFDATSATTTTGLSTGTIAEAGAGGRWATSAAMLIGRLAPTLLAVRLALPRNEPLQPPVRTPLIS